MPKITATVVGNVVSMKKLKELGTKGEDDENYVLNFRIAAQDSHFDRKEKEWKEDPPNFNSVTVWGKKARNVADSIQVGNPVVIHGFLKMNNGWTNKETDEEMPPTQYIEAITVGIDVCAYSGESHRKPKGGASSNSNDESGKSSSPAKSTKSKSSSEGSKSKEEAKPKADDFDLDLDLGLDSDDDPGF